MDISRTMIEYKLEGEDTTRLRAALNAGQKFVETFASNSNNVDAKRQLGYVAFNRDGHVLANIQECKSMSTANKINKDVYDKTISITKTIVAIIFFIVLLHLLQAIQLKYADGKNL